MVISMRDSMKQNTGYQLGNMLLMHFFAALVAFTFGTVAFWWFLGEHIWKELFSIIFIIVYAVILYLRAKKFGNLDAKPYTPMKPRILKGVLFGVCISLTVLLAFVIMRLVWAYAESNYLLMTTGNFIFTFWTFPYYGILGLNEGRVMSYAFVIMIVLPVLMCSVGYIMGCKNKNLSYKLRDMMYEEEDNEE